nr:hypothetical protein [Candidatus Levybacteria bacterium]
MTRETTAPTTEELERRAIYINPEGKRAEFNPEVPTNHKWFTGEYHTSPWGADQSPFGGRSTDRVRVSMVGKKLTPTTRNGIASVYGVVSAVIDSRDQELIGKYGWWKTESFSHSQRPNKRRKM